MLSLKSYCIVLSEKFNNITDINIISVEHAIIPGLIEYFTPLNYLYIDYGYIQYFVKIIKTNIGIMYKKCKEKCRIIILSQFSFY